MKKKLIILAVAAFVFLSSVIAVTVISNTPKNVAMGAIGGFVDDALAREEVRPVRNVLTKGSVAVEMNKCKNGDVDLMEDMAFGGKIYFGKNAIMAEAVSVKVGDIAVLGDVYLSDELIYISEEKMFNESIGMARATLAEEFKNSIFAYGSGSDYAIPDEEVYEMIVNVFEILEDESAPKEGEKLLKKHMKPISKIVLDNLEITSEGEKMRIGGSKKAVRVVTIEIDGKAIAGILTDLCDYLLEDDSIEEYLEEYVDELLPLFEYVYGMEVGDADSLAELYRDALEELSDNLDEICDSLEDDEEIDIKISLVTPKLSKKLLKVIVDIGEDEDFTIDFGGKSIKKAEKITAEFGDFKCSYKITENNGSAYESELEVGDETILSIEINKKKNTFVVEVDGLSVEGSFTKKGFDGKQTILVEKVHYGDGDSKVVYKLDLSITYDEKDKMPKAPTEYMSLSEIKEDDIEAWIKEFE